MSICQVNIIFATTKRQDIFSIKPINIIFLNVRILALFNFFIHIGKRGGSILNWGTRLKIAAESAQGTS